MNTQEEKAVVVTAIISAIVEGLRLLGAHGAPEEALYEAVASRVSRPAFDMIVAELLEQKTVKRERGRLIYCGPCAL